MWWCCIVVVLSNFGCRRFLCFLGYSFIALHCISLQWFVFHCIVFHCIVFHCIVYHCIVFNCIVFNWIVFHYIAFLNWSRPTTHFHSSLSWVELDWVRSWSIKDLSNFPKLFEPHLFLFLPNFHYDLCVAPLALDFSLLLFLHI